MEKINILFTNQRTQIEIDYLKKHLTESYQFIFPETYTEESILEHIKDADVLVGDYVTKEMLEQGDIKLMQLPTAGIDQLNTVLLSKYDITVCNSHSNATAVAESAVALLLSIAKKLPYHDGLLRKGDWNREVQEDTPESLSVFGSYVSGKTIGFIGYGNIARKISRMLSGFDCEYMAVVRDKNKTYKELSFIGDENDLDYVLESSDYLIVAAPLTKDTEGMLNMNNLTKLKPSSYIINISRGRVIEEKSLYRLLSERLIRGAAIDVWYQYPENSEETLPSVNYNFHELNNIIMSPHRADLIYDKYPQLDDVVENIKALKTGEPLKNKLDLNTGY